MKELYLKFLPFLIKHFSAMLNFLFSNSFSSLFIMLFFLFIFTYFSIPNLVLFKQLKLFIFSFFPNKIVTLSITYFIK